MASGTGLTIANMAAAQQPDIRKGTLEAVANKFPLSDVLPFISTNGALVVHAARINPDDQPPQAYRNINSDGIFGAGSLEAITENLAIYHAALKIDKYIKGDSTYLFSPSQQVDFLSEQMSLEMVNAFISGNPSVAFNTDGSSKPAFQPAGLRYRLQNRTNYGWDSDVYTQGITGASIDLTGTITAAIANNLIDSLDELQSLTNANVCFMNFRMYTIFARSLRLGGFLKTTQDQLGREFDTLLGMRIVKTTLKSIGRRLRNTADTTNWVQPWEDTNGNVTPTATATNRFSTIFVANVGANHVQGLTAQGLSMEGPVKLPPPTEASAYQMSYAYGFLVNGFRDVGGLFGLKIG